MNMNQARWPMRLVSKERVNTARVVAGFVFLGKIFPFYKLV